MDYKQHKGNLRGQIKNKVERKLYNKQRRAEAIDLDTSDSQLNIPVVSGMLLDEEIQNECWFQIVNTVEDMSSEPTLDEVIKTLKLNYMVVPRN